MSWWSKLFGSKPAVEKPIEPKPMVAAQLKPNESPQIPQAQWIPAEKNRFGRDLLDLISITGGLLSASKDPDVAAMAMSWSKKFVADCGFNFTGTESLACELPYLAAPDLSAGWLYLPSAMEQKWAIAYRDDAIYMLRSWTGEVKAVGRTRRDGPRLIVETVELADDALRMFGDPIETFDWMLRAHALSQVVPLPLSAGGAKLLQATPLAVFSVFGHVAACAALGWSPTDPGLPLRSINDVMTAVRIEQPARIAALIADGVPVNANGPVAGLTALHVAVVKGSLPLTQRLLDLGADPNVLADGDASALITAIVHRAPIAILDALAHHGAIATTPNADGFGMIHAIAETDRVEYLAWALAHGLDLEAKNKHGHTALHVAAGLGHVAAIRALLAAGADRQAQGTDGLTARQIALAEQKPLAVEALDAPG